MIDIYLRPLEIKDAEISYKWRNNPKVWELTGSKPNKVVTLDIEREWIEKVLPRNNEKRYAICIRSNGEYIGNVQLTDIKNGEAEFHIFIGETKYWGKGIGKNATYEMIRIGFCELHLKKIYLNVNEQNFAAIKAYEKSGFVAKGNINGQIYMEILGIQKC